MTGKRISFQKKQLLKKYHKNRHAISDYDTQELKKLGYINEEGIIPDKTLRVILKPSRIYWEDFYECILDDPNSVTTKVDHQRRSRLVECGYLSKNEAGVYRRTAKLTPKEKKRLYGTGKSLTTTIKEVSKKEDLEQLLEEKRKYFHNMSTTLNLVKQSCTEYGVNYNEYIEN